MQPKLFINAPCDEYEQEADRAAEFVTRMAGTEKEMDAAARKIPIVQRKMNAGRAGVDRAPSVVSDVLASPGQPLDAATRTVLEPRFGHDFSKVSVHATAEAARSAAAVNAQAYTVGNDIVFGGGRYEPNTSAGMRLLAHELTHVVQQQGAAGTLQRSPVFPDASCDVGEIEAKINGYVATALDLVSQTVERLSNPEQVAGPLRRFFHYDPTIPGQALAAPRVMPTLRKNLENIKTELVAAPTKSRCETGPDARGKRGWTKTDPVTGRVIHDEGITYNRHTLRLIALPRQIINTIIHEYAHLAGIGHHEPPDEPISNKDSTKVRGLTTLEALNNAESYMRFVRAVTSEPVIRLKRPDSVVEIAPERSGLNLQEPNPEAQNAEIPNCTGLDELVPPRYPRAEIDERSSLEGYFPNLHGRCFRLLRGGDDSCFGYCLHRAAGGDPLSKGVNLAIPPTIEEFERAFGQSYEPIAIEAVDAANPPADAVLALFARGETPAHVACRSDIQYQGQYLWESKVSPVFPLILHHLSDLEGGGAGDVARFYRRRSSELR